MIDVSQWRASIGLWNYCQAASSRPANGRHSHSFKAAVDSKSGSTTSGEKTFKLPAALSLIAFLLLLFHSLSLPRYILMIPPTGNCYQVQCTTGVTVTDTNYLQSVVLPGGSSSNLIYNDLYLIVCLRMLLLLSGDVELNPGPMIDDRPDISLLIQWLEPLVDWKPFGFCLTEISRHDVLKIEQNRVHVEIEDRKIALYSKWLSVNPQATWRDVIDALASIKEIKLAQDIKNHMASDALSTVSSLSPRTSNSDGDIEMILFPKRDKEVRDSIDDLQLKFSHIMTEIKSVIRKKVTNNEELPTKISDWVESHLHLEPGTVDNNLDDIFKKIYHYYDFSDCSLIVALCNEFISDHTDLLDELKAYSLKANVFRSSRPINELKQKLRKVYRPYRRKLKNMPLICIQLQNPWDKVKIEALKTLIGSLLPKELRQSVMKCITIEEGCVIIKLHILNFTADSLIQYTRRKLEFMRLIGIYSLYINDHPVLQEDENMNFTFELALLEAVITGNNEAVEFLLQLETVNIDHTNEKGKTALMLTCKGGHEDIVHSLLSAGANVNIQDNNGVTALMIASEYNHISIVKLLLKEQIDPNVQMNDGWNALMLACQNGHTQIVELLEKVDPNVQNKDKVNAFLLASEKGHTQIFKWLLKEKVDPNVQDKNGWNSFTLACQNGHTQIVELLLREHIDPNVQMNDGWNALMLACQNGHTQIVELLLKEKVDPNVQNKDKVDAFMLASEKGHTQIVKLLLKEKADPNVQDKCGWNSLMLACQNGHTQIVELLMKEQVDPNVQEKDGANAFILACQNGHTQIVELLMKEQVNSNIQDKNGWNAFMLACQNGHTQIVELLLKEQIDPNVNIQSNAGYTPLMIASANGHIDIVRLLLKWKANPDIQAPDGNTALTLAKNKDIADVVILQSLHSHSRKRSQSVGSAMSSGSRSSFGG